MNRDRYRREDAAVIYRGFNLFPLMTVIENTMYPTRLQGYRARLAKKRAYEMPGLAGPDRAQAKRFPSLLSGGEQLRVAAAI